jgi:hypothetical protein
LVRATPALPYTDSGPFHAIRIEFKNGFPPPPTK